MILTECRTTSSRTAADAIAAWNTRASDPAAQAVVEALEKALMAIDAFWPSDPPENTSQVNEDRAIATVRKQARAALAGSHEAHAKGESDKHDERGQQLKQVCTMRSHSWR